MNLWVLFGKLKFRKTYLNFISNSIKDVSPLIYNPTGRFMVKDRAKSRGYAPVTMLQSSMTDIHNHRSNKESPKDALIAFPNDRVASIKAGEKNKHFR